MREVMLYSVVLVSNHNHHALAEMSTFEIKSDAKQATFKLPSSINISADIYDRTSYSVLSH